MTKECPACQLMNAEDADTCKHCGTAFFFELECLQPPINDPADDLVVVGRYATAMEANIVMSLLEDQGVEACVPEEFSSQVFGNIITGHVDPITVRVAAKDVKAARNILADAKLS